MKNILARGGVKFVAVFLGIAFSLWIDDYQKIYKVFICNIENIDNIINLNNEIVESEKKLIEILNQEKRYNFKEMIGLINEIYSKHSLDNQLPTKHQFLAEDLILLMIISL